VASASARVLSSRAPWRRRVERRRLRALGEGSSVTKEGDSGQRRATRGCFGGLSLEQQTYLAGVNAGTHRRNHATDQRVRDDARAMVAGGDDVEEATADRRAPERELLAPPRASRHERCARCR